MLGPLKDCMIAYMNSTETKKIIKAPFKTTRDILKKLNEQSDFARRCINNDAKPGFKGWLTSIKCKGVNNILIILHVSLIFQINMM